MRDGARPRLPHPALVLVTDSTRRHGRQPEGSHWINDVVRNAVLGGVNVVQLREKHLPRVELIEIGLLVRDATIGRALFFVNGDADAAVTLRADGIHLPEDGPSADAVRARVGGRMLISRAVHSAGAAVQAERDGADLVQLGTVFETQSKPGIVPLGTAGVRAVCAALSIPVIAIGGITAANAAHVLDAGAAGVAVIGAIFDAPQPRVSAADLWKTISGSHRSVSSGAPTDVQ